MFLITAITLQVVLVLLIDAQLYTLYFKRSTSRVLKLCYITQAVMLDILLVSAVLVAFLAISDQAKMITMIWLVYIFMINFFVKLAISLFVSLQWLLRKFFKGRRFRALPFVGLSLAGIAITAMLYGNFYGRKELRVERIEIVSAKIPAAFDGFTIAQFSDAHIGNMGSQSGLIEDLVESINDLNPDIVVQNGDLVNLVSGELNEWYTAQFSKFKAPVYSVLGNHDLGFYVGDTVKTPPHKNVADLLARQRAMGWIVLENESRFIVRDTDSIAIAGVTFANNLSHNGTNSIVGGSNLPKAMAGIDKAIYSVLIAHTPTMFDSIPALSGTRPDLTLSGHVHAMQFKIDICGFKWSPAKWLYPMYSGLYEDRGRYLYVNDGIGFVMYPMRLGARPEITLFTLRSAGK